MNTISTTQHLFRAHCADGDEPGKLDGKFVEHLMFRNKMHTIKIFLGMLIVKMIPFTPRSRVQNEVISKTCENAANDAA
jgi:hypothetical protein